MISVHRPSFLLVLADVHTSTWLATASAEDAPQPPADLGVDGKSAKTARLVSQLAAERNSRSRMQ